MRKKNALKKQVGQFLNLIINIHPHEALYKIMIKEWDNIIDILENIKSE